MQTLDQLGSLFVRFSVVWYISIEAQVEEKNGVFLRDQGTFGEVQHTQENKSI